MLSMDAEKAMAPHSSTLAQKIPWMEEPGRLQSLGLLRARLSDFTFTFHFHALEREMAPHSSILAWRIPGTRSLVGCCLWGHTESDTTEDRLPEFTQTHVHRVSDAIQPSHPLSSPSPPAFNLSHCQGLFQRVSSLHQVAKGLELQHQSFQ